MAKPTNSGECHLATNDPQLVEKKCLCGKPLQLTTLYIINDSEMCSLKCITKFFQDIPVIPSTISYDHSSHSLCNCSVIYHNTKRFEVYGVYCCSVTCINKIRADKESNVSTNENVFRRPDTGGSFAF